MLHVYQQELHTLWNSSNTDTNGTEESEVSLLNGMQETVLGTEESVHIREVSLLIGMQ